MIYIIFNTSKLEHLDFLFFLKQYFIFFNRIMAFLSDMPEWSVSNEDDYNETGTFDSNGIFVSNKVKTICR